MYFSNLTNIHRTTPHLRLKQRFSLVKSESPMNIDAARLVITIGSRYSISTPCPILHDETFLMHTQYTHSLRGVLYSSLFILNALSSIKLLGFSYTVLVHP